MLLQVNVKAKSAFNNKLFALNVVISIPVPDNTAKADIQTTQGARDTHLLPVCESTNQCFVVVQKGEKTTVLRSKVYKLNDITTACTVTAVGIGPQLWLLSAAVGHCAVARCHTRNI